MSYIAYFAYLANSWLMIFNFNCLRCTNISQVEITIVMISCGKLPRMIRFFVVLCLSDLWWGRWCCWSISSPPSPGTGRPRSTRSGRPACPAPPSCGGAGRSPPRRRSSHQLPWTSAHTRTSCNIDNNMAVCSTKKSLFSLVLHFENLFFLAESSPERQKFSHNCSISSPNFLFFSKKILIFLC